MLEENTPSNSARCNPQAHVTVVNGQTFQQLAQGNASLLPSTMLYPNVLFPLASFNALSSHVGLVFSIASSNEFCSLPVSQKMR